MSLRVTVVTTRTGDDGSTGLGDKTRVSKSSLRICVLGEVDELNSTIGVWRSLGLPNEFDAILARVQNALFDLGGQLCLPSSSGPDSQEPSAQLLAQPLQQLDQAIKDYGASLPPLREFVLPGGCQAAAWGHMARTVSRRAERSLVALAQTAAIPFGALQYLNRLSDLCFILARHLNQNAGVEDVLWQR